jgi:hypothetical protein
MYVMVTNIYFIFLYIHIYIFIVRYSIINCENNSHSYLQMNTKLKLKELCRFWIQRKGEHSYIRSEYAQNSVVGMYRYVCS